MSKRNDPNDPSGLIFESYRIANISPEACRSIFFDWALGLPDHAESRKAAAALLERFAAQAPDHPMTTLLRAAGSPAPQPRRRQTRRGACPLS